MHRSSTCIFPIASVLVLIAFGTTQACSSGFTSCRENRVCPTDAAGAGGESGAAGSTGTATPGGEGGSGTSGTAGQSAGSTGVEPACSSDEDCEGLTPRCDDRGQCVACSVEDNSGCEGATTICSDQGGGVSHCVQCELDEDCDDGSCLGGECVAGCGQDTDCSGTRDLCGQDDLCVECRSEADCKDDMPLCSPSGLCAECVEDTDCPEDRPACTVNECSCPLPAAELANDLENCGTCGNVCPDGGGEAGCEGGQCVVLMVCGNAIVESGEDCDDGNANDFDECTTNCTRPECGNGTREGNEGCDDGNEDDTDECTNDCKLAGCGDGAVEGAETCDPPDGVTCNAACQEISCGDEIVDGEEACDPPDAVTCNSECQTIECGDEVVEGEEQCDPPDGVNCDSQCQTIECEGSDIECAALGRSCNTPGALACNGTAQKLRLICEGGQWTNNGTCDIDENCDSGGGTCGAIISGCEGGTGGTRYCDGKTLRACGSDLVTSSVVEECTAWCSDVDDASACERVEQVTAGYETTCVLTNLGRVKCWGLGSLGQLGQGNTFTIGDNETPAVVDTIDLGGKAKQISGLLDHTCAVLEGGAVRCWGNGTHGQLGYADTETIGDNETPASMGDVPVGGPVKRISAGGLHTCALLESGAVRCWGDGSAGALGYGNTETVGDNETPESFGESFGNVDVGDDVIDIGAGYFHTCALLEGGNVRCWGNSDYYGQLGYGNVENIGDNEAPSSVGYVSLGGPAKQLSVGLYHTCVLMEDGDVRCWGWGHAGRLGTGSQENIGDDEVPSSIPRVNIRESVLQLSAGVFVTCALLESGDIRCWGNGLYGALGYDAGEYIGDNEAPVSGENVILGGIATQVAAGGGYWEADHACALLDTGHVRCWGTNDSGQLGYGHTDYVGVTQTPASAGNVPIF